MKPVTIETIRQAQSLSALPFVDSVMLLPRYSGSEATIVHPDGRWQWWRIEDGSPTMVQELPAASFAVEEGGLMAACEVEEERRAWANIAMRSAWHILFSPNADGGTLRDDYLTRFAILRAFCRAQVGSDAINSDPDGGDYTLAHEHRSPSVEEAAKVLLHEVVRLSRLS